MPDAQHSLEPSWRRSHSIYSDMLRPPATLGYRGLGARTGLRRVFGRSKGCGEGEMGWICASPGSPCPLLLLQIHFWEAQSQNESARVKTLFLPENGVKLKNLTGYTSYWVSVAAFNAAGDGPRSPPVKGRTQQAGGSHGTAAPSPSLSTVASRPSRPWALRGGVSMGPAPVMSG